MSTSPSSAVGDAGDVQADQHALPLPALDTPTAAPGENRDGGDSVKTCDPAFVDSNETLSAENANAATELEASEVVEASPHRDCIPASSVRPSISETTLHTKTAGAAELSPTVPVVAPLALASTGVAGEVSLGAPSLATTGAEFNNDFVDNEDDARDESSHAAILDSDAGPEVTEPVAGAGDVEQLKTEDDNKELGDTLTTDATAEGSQGVEATSAGDATSQKGVGAEASENAALRPPHSNARTKPLFHSDTDARARTDQSRAIEGAPNLPETLILSSVIQTTEASTADGQARTFLPCVVCTLFTISFQSKDVALITASRIESDSVAKPETEATFPPQPSSTAIEDDYSRLWETPTTESRRSSSTSQPRPTAVSAPSSYSFATRGGKPVVTIFAGEDADEHLLYGEGDEPVVEEAEPDVDEAARLAREEEARKFRSNAEPDKHRGKFTGHWPRPGDPPRPKGGTPEPFKPKEEVRNASKPNNYLESLERDWEAQWGSIAGAPPRQETVAKDHEFPRTFNFLPENPWNRSRGPNRSRNGPYFGLSNVVMQGGGFGVHRNGSPSRGSFNVLGGGWYRASSSSSGGPFTFKDGAGFVVNSSSTTPLGGPINMQGGGGYDMGSSSSSMSFRALSNIQQRMDYAIGLSNNLYSAQPGVVGGRGGAAPSHSASDSSLRPNHRNESFSYRDNHCHRNAMVWQQQEVHGMTTARGGSPGSSQQAANLGFGRTPGGLPPNAVNQAAGLLQVPFRGRNDVWDKGRGRWKVCMWKGHGRPILGHDWEECHHNPDNNYDFTASPRPDDRPAPGQFGTGTAVFPVEHVRSIMESGRVTVPSLHNTGSNQVPRRESYDRDSRGHSEGEELEARAGSLHEPAGGARYGEGPRAGGTRNEESRVVGTRNQQVEFGALNDHDPREGGTRYEQESRKCGPRNEGEMRGFGAHIEQDSRADKTRYGQEIRAGGVRWERGQQPAPRGGGRDGEQLQEGRVGGVCSRDERQHEPLYASRRLSQERQVGPSNTRRDYEEHQARGREDVRREHQSDPRRVESYRQRPEQEPLSRSQPHKVDQQLEIRADGTGMEPQQQEIRPGDDWKESDPQPEAARTTAGKAREKKLNKRLFELRQRAFPGPGPSTSAAAVAPSEALASRPSNSSFRHNSIMPPSEDHATRPSEASKKNKIVVPAINDPASRKLGSPPKARISITRKASKDGDAPVQFLERSASSVTTTGTSQESGERNERRTRIAPGISQSTQEDDREASEQNEGHHASGFGRRRSDAEAKIKGRRKNSVRGVNPAAMAFVPSRPQTPDAVRALRAEIAEDEERRAQEDRKIAEKKKRLAEIVERQNSWVGDRQKGI